MSHSHHGLRAIAVFETLKGSMALAALLAVIDLIHQDVRAQVSQWIAFFDLDPNAHLAAVLLEYAERLPQADVEGLAMVAVAYAALRFVEAWGLWHDMLWAEYLGAGSGGIYVPFELYEFVQKPGWLTAVVSAINLFIVGYLVLHLWHEKHDMPGKIDKWRTS
jgi:uncharacterized membrane protein (DUF2068 family)